jgi:hypothetical protein
MGGQVGGGGNREGAWGGEEEEKPTGGTHPERNRRCERAAVLANGLLLKLARDRVVHVQLHYSAAVSKALAGKT